MQRFVIFVHWLPCVLMGVCVCACMVISVSFFACTVSRGWGLQWRTPAWAVMGITAYALNSFTSPLFSCLLRRIQTGDLTQDLTPALTLHLSASHCDLSADLLLGSLCKSSLNGNLFELPRLNTCSVHMMQMCERERWWPLGMCDYATVSVFYYLTAFNPGLKNTIWHYLTLTHELNLNWRWIEVVSMSSRSLKCHKW